MGYFGAILFVLFQSWSALNFKEDDSDKRCLLKVLINHSFYLSFLTKLKMKWSEEFLSFMEVNDKYINAVPRDGLSFGCFLLDSVHINDVSYYEQVLITISPIILTFGCFLLRAFIGLMKMTFLFIKGKSLKTIKRRIKYNELKITVLAILISVIYNLYSKLVTNTLQLLKCINLDNSNSSFLETNPNVECWGSEEHSRLLKNIFTPNFIIWCVGWPTFLMWSFQMKIFKHRKSLRIELMHTITHSGGRQGSQEFSRTLTDVQLKSQIKNALNENQVKMMLKSPIYKYLVIDYRPKCFYWEVFFFLTNLLLSLVTVLTSRLNFLSQGALLISIYSVMLICTQILAPFKKDRFNTLNEFSYISIMITIGFSVLTVSSDTDSHQKMIYFYIIILVNGMFYSILVYFLLFEVTRKLKNSLASITIGRRGNAVRT